MTDFLAGLFFTFAGLVIYLGLIIVPILCVLGIIRWYFKR